ncbi:DeoR/GlpR family DNA-binding transcription regulator [Chryseolinea sp. H1M3-3]|uniref:DeoR/GlpR family DNA-binding transcription regulator n=1 Tax=Chryseolinea sp. H1M3-3 TaxID=3034144 RepID=UPI0023EDFB21|nr:DeoR/GlpR family DNA-binding transcription regulator [Chryseolinea sp. H1M3-3]
MLQEERHNYIIQQIHTNNKVIAAELCKQLKVSLDTIRRDIKELEKRGKVVKVHGGAISPHFHQPFQPQEVYAREEKKEIAKKALSLIKDGMTLLTGGGTVMLELARMLPERLSGVLFTVSPLVALEAAQRSTVEVILLGGKLSSNSYICTGASVSNAISELHVDLCLLGTNGLSLEDGITDFDWEVAQVKKAILKASDQKAFLSISEKLGSSQKMQVCKLNAIDYLITELNSSDEKFDLYRKACKVL